MAKEAVLAPEEIAEKLGLEVWEQELHPCGAAPVHPPVVL